MIEQKFLLLIQHFPTVSSLVMRRQALPQTLLEPNIVMQAGGHQVDLRCWNLKVSLHKESGAKCHLIKFEHVPASTEESLEGFRQKV